MGSIELSRQEAIQELQGIASEFQEFTKGPLRLALLMKTPVVKQAKETPLGELGPLLKLYFFEEKRLTTQLARKRKNLQAELHKQIASMKLWAHKERLKGKTKEAIFRDGDKKLQTFKISMDEKLLKLKKQGLKDFEKLESTYAKKHPEFEDTLTRRRRLTKGLKTAGKTLLKMSIAILVFVLLSMSIKTILFYVFKEAIDPLLEGAGDFGAYLQKNYSFSPRVTDFAKKRSLQFYYLKALKHARSSNV